MSNLVAKVREILGISPNADEPETLTEARRLRDLFAAKVAPGHQGRCAAACWHVAGSLRRRYSWAAYLTSDPLRGEMMLRPDFTVPVVQMHMERRADPARYTYSGKVFRKQEEDETRANEYVQVGYEVFDRPKPCCR